MCEIFYLLLIQFRFINNLRMVEEYIIQCWSCLASFDAWNAGWCAHIPPSKICPYCLRCSCNAPDNYKEEVWKKAPQELIEERGSVTKGKEPLGEMLLRSGKLTPEILKAALKRQEEEGVKLGEILVKMNVITKDELELYLISQRKIATISLKDRDIDLELVKKIGFNFCVKNKCLPLGVEEFQSQKIIPLVMANPFDFLTISAVSSATSLKVIPYHADPEELEQIINELQKKFKKPSFAREDEKEFAIIEGLLRSGIRRSAEEIYIEPHDSEFRIFFRIEGLLFKAVPISREEHPNLISSLIEIANINKNYQKVLRKGKITLAEFRENYEIHVQSTPSRFGNIISIKIIDKKNFGRDLKEIGLTDLDIKDITDTISKREGVCVVSAPLFHHSPSTLYSLMKHYLNEGWRVTSVEPFIYTEIPGITQIEIEERFPPSYIIKKAIDTQPDILFVFSLQDESSINILFRYSINFPIILEVNARNSAQAIHVLRDMVGINPKILSERLKLVLNQRMIRRLCENCKEPAKTPFEVDLKIADLDTYEFTFYKERGCEECNRTGFKGRFPIYEILKINPVIKELIVKGANEKVIRETAKRLGFITLGQNCVYKIVQGLTSTTEYLKGNFD